MGNDMNIRRLFFTKESEWMRNVYRDDKDGPWCRYEDVEPLLERVKELERQNQVLEKQVRYTVQVLENQVRYEDE
jgi:hypothetical protein